MIRVRCRFGVFRWLGLLLLALQVTWAAAAKEPPLPPTYAHWLKNEVPYLISDQERDLFLSLKTDKARDTFIDSFWKARNPDPNAPLNNFKEEHYRRLAYANANFGNRIAGDGSRTDRGMVYITLGPPQQRASYPNSKYLEPLEIWFYQSPSPALPTHFSVIFFKPDPAEEFRLYSPYGDRPEKLVASTNAVNDEKAALKIIDTDLGPEVARLTLSLIPGEPVDLREGYPSLQSDALLDKIRNYRNLPENLDLLSRRRELAEGVGHRILLGDRYVDLAVLATRDGPQQASVHYSFRFLNPQDFALVKDDKGLVFYSLSVSAKLTASDGTPIYADHQDVKDYLSNAQLNRMRAGSLAVEGRLPAAPGTYRLHLEVTNKSTAQSFAAERTFVVPGFDSPLGISQVVFAAPEPPVPDRSRTAPFGFSGVRISPAGADNAALYAGGPLRVLFQIWEKPDSPVAASGKSLDISYLIGQVSSSNSTDKHEDAQTVDRGTFDANGNLLIGKDLSTAGLTAGNYRLVVRVNDAATHETVSQAINFRLVSEPSHAPLSILSPSFAPATDASMDTYRRGICALAQHQPVLATFYLKQAITADPQNVGALRELAKAYRLAGDATAALAAEKQVQSATTPRPPSQNN